MASVKYCGWQEHTRAQTAFEYDISASRVTIHYTRTYYRYQIPDSIMRMTPRTRGRAHEGRKTRGRRAGGVVTGIYMCTIYAFWVPFIIIAVKTEEPLGGGI